MRKCSSSLLSRWRTPLDENVNKDITLNGWVDVFSKLNTLNLNATKWPFRLRESIDSRIICGALNTIPFPNNLQHIKHCFIHIIH